MIQAMRDYFVRIGEYGPVTVAIELLLIGLVIYVALRFLQGTRGLRLLEGLTVILVVAFLLVRVVAQYLHLERIKVLFSPLVYVVFFGSLVVFQPELRRALMRLGENRLFRHLMRTGESVIEPIVQSATYLSRNKIGALIAIERQVGLGSIIESGVRIDAQVSAELLNTIFWPGSALHDMGVVIQENAIAAAGCQFPLSESEQLDRRLGSRHRAAVGLTEDSDALVVVVSEETGAISLAVDGRLMRALTPQALRNELLKLVTVG